MPGPIATVFVECLPVEPGEISPAQDHLKMTLIFDGNNIRKMLIPIWVSLICYYFLKFNLLEVLIEKESAVVSCEGNRTKTVRRTVEHMNSFLLKSIT